MPLYLRIAAAISVFAFAGTFAHAQTDAPGGVSFKKTQIGINDSARLSQNETAANAHVAPAVSPTVDREELEEKKQTLETELRYARTKLDSAQKKLSVHSAAGNADQVEKLNAEIRDWEARIKASKDQIAVVEADIARVKPTGPTISSDADMVLPGENLEIYVNEDQSFNGRYVVRRGGYIILPQVGRIIVAGKSLSQAEASVKRALENSQLTKATVLMERIEGNDVEQGQVIFLNGEFKNARPFKIAAGTAPTLISVMLSCGGYTDRADLTRVKVMRMAGGRPVVEEVNVQKMLDGQGPGSDMVLGSGDVITVPAGPPNQIFVTGNVKRQGPLAMTDGEQLTAYGAILNAGGFARFADERHTHILRAMPDGTKRKIPVDVVDVRKGRKQDLPLQPNDIIVVPEKWFSF